MKRSAFLPIFAVALVAACQDAPTSVPAGTGAVRSSVAPGDQIVAMASGQGTMVGSAGRRRIFEFQAFKFADGREVGSGMLTRAPADPERREQFRFAIDCMVVEGNMARMSGTVTEVVKTNPSVSNPIVPGEVFQFKVVDNGEGDAANPDLMTNFANAGPLWGPPPPCWIDSGWPLYAVTTGNVQVKVKS